MKKKISFNINFTNRAIYTLITFSIFLLIGISVFAFGTSSPSTFGHSAGELDLSAGVQGDVLFNGDVKTNGNIDVAGGIKVGTIAICDTNNIGTLRFNGTNFQGCDGGDWKELGGGTGTGTGSSYTGDLITGSNTGTDCSEAGGIPTDMGGGEYVCKFLGESCATGWTQYESWSTTSPQFCAGGGSGGCFPSPCSTGSHAFSDNTQETCPYTSRGFTTYPGVNEGYCYDVDHTCYSTIQEVGCY